MPKRKYTAEILKPIVESSLSFAEVVRNLGLKQTGGSQTNIKKLVLEYDLDTTHFLGRARNQGEYHRGGPEKTPADEILVLRDSLKRPEEAHRLRRAMIEIGILYRCAWCGLEDVWNDKPLMLIVDHINGHRYDNRRENLRFLCPNCHSQTPTFGKNLGFTDVTTRKRWASNYRKKRAELKNKK